MTRPSRGSRRARAASLAALAAGLALTPPAEAPPGRAGGDPAGTRTGKERLSAKWRDEQRVDDCKVPEALRDPRRHRPGGCGDAP